MQTMSELPVLPGMTWPQMIDKVKTYKTFGVPRQFRLNFGAFRTLILSGAFDEMIKEHIGYQPMWADYEKLLYELAVVMKYKPAAPKARKTARVSLAEQAAAITGDMGLTMWRLSNNPVTTVSADVAIIKKTLEGRGAIAMPPGSPCFFKFDDMYVLKDISTLKKKENYNFFKEAGRNIKGQNGWIKRPYPAILCMILSTTVKKTKKGSEMMVVSVLHGDSTIEGIICWSMEKSGVMSQKIVQQVKSGAYGLLKFRLNEYNGKQGYILEDFQEIKA